MNYYSIEINFTEVIDLEQNFAAGLLNFRSRSKDYISLTLAACYIRHVL